MLETKPFAQLETPMVRRVLSGKSRAHWSSACVLGLLLFGSTTARAEEADPHAAKLACANAFEQAQRERNASHFSAATREALSCAKPTCGEALFDECTKLYSELQQATPSVVFGARDSDGKELLAVRVSLDGKPLLQQLDGKAVPLDPGNHAFSFTADGYEPIDESLLIRAGEQFRPISITFQATKLAHSGAAVDGSGEQAGTLRPPPVASYVLGGVSVVGLAAFIGFRVAGANEFDSLSRDCKPTCSASSVDAVRAKYVVSDIALGIGAAAAAAAVAVYLIAPRPQSSDVALQLGPAGHGIAARLAGHF